MALRFNTATSRVSFPPQSLSDYTIFVEYAGTSTGSRKPLVTCYERSRSFIAISENDKLGFDTRDNFYETDLTIADNTKYVFGVAVGGLQTEVWADGILLETFDDFIDATVSNINNFGGGLSGGLAPSSFLAPSPNLAPSSPVASSCNGDVFKIWIFDYKLTPQEMRGFFAMSSPAQDYTKANWNVDNMSSDNVIDVTEKQTIVDWWNAINGDGSASGSYWVTRASLVSSGGSTTNLDSAFTALRSYLISNTIFSMSAPYYQPTVIQSPSTIVDSEWKLIWESYYSAESAAPELITNAVADTITTEIIETVETETVPQFAPKYLGIGQLSSLTSATFTGATVDDDGVITVGSSVTANIGDWMVNYLDNATFDLSVYVWGGTTWAKTSITRYIDSCQTDIFNLGVAGYAIDGLTIIQNAMIKNLLALNLKLLNAGKLFSGNGNFFNSDTPSYIGADGRVSFGDTLAYDGGILSIKGGVLNGNGQSYGGSYVPAKNSAHPFVSIYNGQLSLKRIFQQDIYSGIGTMLSINDVISNSSTKAVRVCRSDVLYGYHVIKMSGTDIIIEHRTYNPVTRTFAINGATPTITRTTGEIAISYIPGGVFVLVNNTIRYYSYSSGTYANTATLTPGIAITNMCYVASLGPTYNNYLAIGQYGSPSKIYLYLFNSGAFSLITSCNAFSNTDVQYNYGASQVYAYRDVTDNKYYCIFAMGSNTKTYKANITDSTMAYSTSYDDSPILFQSDGHYQTEQYRGLSLIGSETEIVLCDDGVIRVYNYTQSNSLVNVSTFLGSPTGGTTEGAMICAISNNTLVVVGGDRNAQLVISLGVSFTGRYI